MMASNLSLIMNEQIVINQLIDKPDSILRFDQNYFVSSIAQNLFSGIKNCYLENFSLTPENIVIFSNKIDAKITKELIENLRNTPYDKEGFEKHFLLLRKDYAKHRIENKLLRDTLTTVSSKNELDVNKLLELQDELTQAVELIQGKESLMYSPQRMFDEYHVAINKRSIGEHKYSTGDSYLDRYLTLGFAPKLITTFFGGTGEGKSAFALSLINKQINKSIPSLYISLENTSELTMDRLIAMRNNISYTRLYPKNGEELDDSVLDMVRAEKIKFEKMKYFSFVEEPSLSMSDVESIIKECKRKMKVNYLIVTIDLFSMLKEFSQDITPQNIEQGINQWHEIVKRNNIHSLNVLQANSESLDYKPKSIKDIEKMRPNINNIKNSKAFGERSRVVLSAFRPKYYAERIFGKDCPEVEAMTDFMRIRVEKQNQGLSNIDIPYLFDGDKFKIYRYVKSTNV